MPKRASQAKIVWASAWFLLSFLNAGSVDAAGSVNPRQGPKILVPPVLGVARKTSLKSHYVIVHALRQRFGKRVVDDLEVLQAQKKLHIWPRKLRQQKAVAELAQSVGAERALIISSTRRGLSVAVYADVNKPAARIIKIRKIRAKRIGKKQARRIAKIVARKATLLLSAEPFPELTAISPKVAKNSGTGQAAEAQSADSSWDAIDVQVGDSPGVPDAEAEILAEEQREQALRKSINSNKNNKMSVFMAAGFALSKRQLDVSGSQAAWVIPVQAGLLPYLSLSAAVFPLHFVPALQKTPYKDLALRMSYQRAVYRSLYQGEEIAVDDDKMNMRLSYSQALWSWKKSPSLGLGLGYGWQRAEIQSDAALMYGAAYTKGRERFGNNWADISDGLHITQFYSLGVSQTVQDKVITGAQDNGTFLKTASNWDAVIGGDGMECIIDYTNSNIMYGEVYYGAIRKSTNGGNSFLQ